MSYGDRVTKKDLRATFGRYVELMQKHGFVTPGHRLGMDEGSKVNGIAYRIFEVGTDETVPGWSGHGRPMIGDDFLGMTAAEADHELRTRYRVVADVLAALKGDQ